MVDKRYIVIRVAYEPSVYGRSLEWIAPELKDAGLTLIEEHADECGASRTWAGVVDGATSQRFADAWHLPDEFHEPAAANLAEDGHIARARRTFDGMNWEVDGESPIVSVSVEIGVIRDSPRRRGHRRRRPPALIARRGMPGCSGPAAPDTSGSTAVVPPP
jgi:hypothetical protein